MIKIPEGFLQVQVILLVIFFNEFAQRKVFQDLFNLPESINVQLNSDWFVVLIDDLFLVKLEIANCGIKSIPVVIRFSCFFFGFRFCF